jgi:hypothetical protein
MSSTAVGRYSRRTVTLPPELERHRRVSVPVAAALKGISEDSFRRHFAHLIERTTPRRDTVRLSKVIED